MSVRFDDCDCELKFSQYANRRVAISLVDAHTGEPVATATVNVPDAACPSGCVFIKDWGDNAGVLAALTAAGVVRDAGTRVPCGFEQADLCYLRMDPATKKKVEVAS